MNMNYEIKKTNKGGNQKYFFTYKSDAGKKITKVCKDCSSYEEAKKIAGILLNCKDEEYKIKNIAADMYLPESSHLARLRDFGKNLSPVTISQKRYFINLIIKRFGEEKINELKIRNIENFLLNDKKHGGSWKNFYLEIFGEIYTETIWKCNVPVIKPKFTKFARNSKKADVLTTEELNRFFSLNYWDKYRDYLIFLCIASCGLRLGEARAMKVNQILNEKFLLINGFCLYDGTRTNYNKKGSASDKKIRVAPLPETTYKLIMQFIKDNQLSSDDYLFQSSTKRPLAKKYLESVFRQQLAKAGIIKDDRKLVPHSLRFTYVTRMRRSLNIEQVQKIVGHSSVDMTEYYTRKVVDTMVEGLRGTSQAVNNLFN